MTITEFLEARIEEDEMRAGSGWARLEDSRWTVDNYGRNFLTPSAVLAECAAKRATLDASASYSPELEHGDNGEWAFDVACRNLAAVYADHPDYQQEWSV